MSIKKDDERALARAMPTQVVKYLGDISRRFRLTFSQAVFIALVKLDFTAKDAYLFVRPHVKPKSAAEAGCKWKASLASALAGLSIEDALIALSDFAVTRGMLHPNADIGVKAASEFNRTRGRHKQEEPERPSPFQALLLLVGEGERGQAPPQAGDGPPSHDTPGSPRAPANDSQEEILDAEFEPKEDS